MVMAREAIICHIEGLLMDGAEVPRPQSIEAHITNPDFADATWILVQINENDLPGKAKRINITINERVLEVIDEFARREHETRSGFLQKAATRYIESVKAG